MNRVLLFGTFALSFLVAYAFTPLLIYSARKKNLVEADGNKPGKPMIARFGGLAIFAGMASGILAAILFATYILKDLGLQNVLLASLGTISLVALVGLVDDLFKLRLFFKTILPVVGAFPLVAIKAGRSALNLPFIGWVNVGTAYPLAFVPLGVTGAANALNMAAGYNGLEAGIGAVAFATLFIIAWHGNALPAAVLFAAGLGACLAFLKYNWFPAKIFPGDVGTLSIGALLAAAVIVGKMEKYGVILLLPAFYELAATFYYSLTRVSRRQVCQNPNIAPDGTLSPPRGSENYTLFYKILSVKPMREPHLVLTLLALFALCGVAALAVYWLGL